MYLVTKGYVKVADMSFASQGAICCIFTHYVTNSLVSEMSGLLSVQLLACYLLHIHSLCQKFSGK